MCMIYVCTCAERSHVQTYQKSVLIIPPNVAMGFTPAKTPCALPNELLSGVFARQCWRLDLAPGAAAAAG